MSKRRLLVTGSRGFVGTTLLAETRTRYPDIFEPVAFNDPASGEPVNLNDAGAIDRAIAAIVPDVVVHLAAIAAPREAKKDPGQAWSVNLMGSFHLANAVLRHAPQARFIWAGSSEAYGSTFNTTTGPIDEDAALEPASAYGATKAACDIMLRQMAHEGLRITVFRPFNHTGPGQSEAYVVSAFAQQIAQIEAGLQEPVLKVGNLEAERDFLDVRDVAGAYLAAALDDTVPSGKAYNLSTGKPVSIRSILDMLTSMSRVPVTVEVDPARYSENAIPVASGNPARARQDFGWKPGISLQQTLCDVLDYWRSRA